MLDVASTKGSRSTVSTSARRCGLSGAASACLCCVIACYNWRTRARRLRLYHARAPCRLAYGDAAAFSRPGYSQTQAVDEHERLSTVPLPGCVVSPVPVPYGP
ncbi:hypothetical protein EXIGLDRAFT_723703 [Exidia glandulosa HHB12029]|uniref:Uncharacterized protein n=1 Tax=Exidia glandulosa HHB12029 TaxID=1314781 RepID=A0A165EPR2_EXIGL|nr:hypothetical protein EXIGLDRAFT_723703 [Exidia glandulosa HHB12029]